MSDEKPQRPSLDQRPSFNDPFATPLTEIPLSERLAQQDRNTPSYNFDPNVKPSPLSVRLRSSAPSIVSSRRSMGSNPDLLQHASSAFASSRKANSTRTGSQVFRKPRPSTMLIAEIPKPWLKYKDPAHRWAKWIFWACWFVGICVVAALCYQTYASIPSLGNICMVMEDDFTSGSISNYLWEHDVTVDPGILGTFQWTTASPNNSFVQDSTLFLVPTLTSDYLGQAAIIDAHTVNLTADGTCTSTNVSHCVARSNATLGTVINPVQGVRLKSKFSITYGKVEIVARLPTGDWIWPTLRLMPVDNVYGAWPRSGEIDILNARGNAPGYGELGSDFMQSALHWGPNKLFDSYFRTWGIRRDKVSGYASGYRKYTLEWNADYLMTYIDNKVQTALTVKFDKNFWERGDYPTFYTDENGDIARLESPWFGSQAKSAPFDQPFYLELSLAVGGTSNYFPDNLGLKPWQDSSPLAMSDFWTAKDRWVPTWPADTQKRGMAIKSVKMYKTC